MSSEGEGGSVIELNPIISVINSKQLVDSMQMCVIGMCQQNTHMGMAHFYGKS
jgi:hypothetical protein